MSQPAPLDASPGATAGGFKYWAFISYSSKDRVWGEWLIKSLEGYRTPRAFVGRATTRGEPVPRRPYPVFRDRDELPTDADLGSAIRNALQQSRYLIVICSPNSAASRWVNEEILTFKRFGREHRILSLIVDGSPNASLDPAKDPKTECYPNALRFALGADGNLSLERTHPISADARERGDGKPNALLKLLAGVLGVNYDDLKQRDRQRRRRQLVVRALAGGLALTLAGGAAFRFWSAERTAASVQATGEGRAAIGAARALSAWPGSLPAALGVAAPGTRAALSRAVHTDLVGFMAVAGAYEARYAPKGDHVLVTTLTGDLAVFVPGADAPRHKFYVDGGVHPVFGPAPSRVFLLKPDDIAEWDYLAEKKLRSVIREKATAWDGMRGDAAQRQLLLFGEKKLEVVDTTTLQPVATLAVDAEIRDALFSPDGTSVLAGLADGRLLRWVHREKSPPQFSRLHQQRIDGLALSRDGKILASAAGADPIRLWSLSALEPLGELGLWHTGDLFKGQLKPQRLGDFLWIDFLPDNRLVAIESDDIRVWDIKALRPILHLEADEGAAEMPFLYVPTYRTLGAVAPDGSTMTTVDPKQAGVMLWRLTRGPEVALRPFATEALREVVVSPDSQRMVCVDHEGAAALIDTARGEIVAKLPAAEINSMDPLRCAFSPDSTEFFFGTSDGGTDFYRAQTGERRSRTADHIGGVSYRHNRALVLYNPVSKRIVFPIPRPKLVDRVDPARSPIEIKDEEINSSRCWMLPDGERLLTVVGFDEQRAQVRSLEGRILKEFPWPGASIARFSSDDRGRRVLLVTLDGQVRIWDTIAGREIGAFNERNRSWRAAVLSHDGTRLLVDAEHGVALIDVATGLSLASYRGIVPRSGSDGVAALAFMNDDRAAVIATNSGTVRIVALPPVGSALIAAARQRAAGER